MKKLIKRDGRVAAFDSGKIAAALLGAFTDTGELGADDESAPSECGLYAREIERALDDKGKDPVHIEDVQDEVERFLMGGGFYATAKAYILYREKHSHVRKTQERLMTNLGEIINAASKDSDLKRGNANVDGQAPMGTMLLAGSAATTAYFAQNTLAPRFRHLFESGYIHIHDFEFYGQTLTCCQIDLERLFENGFGTGHGFLREPMSIAGYGALAAIALQANQNDMHGGQSIPSFDRFMAEGVKKTFTKQFAARLADALEDAGAGHERGIAKDVTKHAVFKEALLFALTDGGRFDKIVSGAIAGGTGLSLDETERIVSKARKRAEDETEKQTHQAMEAFVHNLNTMHSRAGAQVPFTSINYGTDTSPWGRTVTRQLLLATMEGLGNGETPIFPIQVFRVKKGVNLDEGDPNHDLFKLALECTSKRMFPNFSFQDASFNLKYYREGHPETEISYMGCRTRVIGNVHDPSREISYSRGNLSFTSINLVRLAIEAQGDKGFFVRSLCDMLSASADQLLERFDMQSRRKVCNFPFLMGQGIWLDSDKLAPEDSIAEVIKHGTLSIGFIGLAECLVSLIGKHHGESREARELGLEIVRTMREFCDAKSKETGLNFTLIASPAEGLSGRFTRLDRQMFGTIKGVTDREFYTNSFHVPVYCDITAFKKIEIEAPYHELTNAGHITYIELDGDLSNNLEALERVVRHMGESGIGYGAINHPIDRDPVCGYTGVIGDSCPKCGRTEKDGPGFERIRRITGYLVGTLDRFNDAKRAEEASRVKHP
jgi:ribonucleoside-triphosphate reductase